jgi:ribonuclease J
MAIEEGVPENRVVVASNGDLLEISSEGASVVEQLETGRVFVHGKGVGDIGHDVLRDRRGLAETGLVVVALAVSKQSGRLISGPELHSLGVTFDEIEQELLDKVTLVLKDRLSALNPQNLDQWEQSKEEIRLVVRRNINKILGRKPLVKTVILQT